MNVKREIFNIVGVVSVVFSQGWVAPAFAEDEPPPLDMSMTDMSAPAEPAAAAAPTQSAASGSVAAPSTSSVAPPSASAPRPPAGATAGGPPKGPHKDSVLDFEGELIEGTRSAPDLLLQQDLGKLSVETNIFERENFNDFHAVDRKRRPRFFDPGARRK